MKPDRSAARSKLDAFCEQLLALDGAGKKLPEIQAWLESQNMHASISCISNFLTKVRTARAREAKANDPRSLEYFPGVKAKMAALRNFFEKHGFYGRRRKRRKF